MTIVDTLIVNVTDCTRCIEMVANRLSDAELVELRDIIIRQTSIMRNSLKLWNGHGKVKSSGSSMSIADFHHKWELQRGVYGHITDEFLSRGMMYAKNTNSQIGDRAFEPRDRIRQGKPSKHDGLGRRCE